MANIVFSLFVFVVLFIGGPFLVAVVMNYFYRHYGPAVKLDPVLEKDIIEAVRKFSAGQNRDHDRDKNLIYRIGRPDLILQNRHCGKMPVTVKVYDSNIHNPISNWDIEVCPACFICGSASYAGHKLYE